MKISYSDFKRTILEKFKQNNGRGYFKMMNDKIMELWISADGKGVENSQYKCVCDFVSLYAVYEKAIELGGKMYLGAKAAQDGKKIGSSDLSIDTIDAFVSMEFDGKDIGDTTTRRSTYYSAILDWAGFVSKCRGGFIVVRPQYMEK